MAGQAAITPQIQISHHCSHNTDEPIGLAHMQTDFHHEGHTTTPIATQCRTPYVDGIKPDCRDTVRSSVFFWNWGSGLAIFNLPMNVATIILEYLPSWIMKGFNSGRCCGIGMTYAPAVRWAAGQQVLTGLQISHKVAAGYDNVRRRMRPTGVFCPYCFMWLRDVDEYAAHLSSEPHKRRLTRLDRQARKYFVYRRALACGHQ